MTVARPTADQRALEAACAALRGVVRVLPRLAGLAFTVRVQISRLIDTCGIFRSGRLVVNPAWFADLSRQDAVFVMAHELMHLELRAHERAEGDDALPFNIAQDAVINDYLAKALKMSPPREAVVLEGAWGQATEALLSRVEWTTLHASADVLPKDLEPAFDEEGRPPGFSRTRDGGGGDSTPLRLDELTVTLAQARALAEEHGTYRPGPTINAERGKKPVRWNHAIEQWLGGAERRERSYARSSRRQAYGDVVLPGRNRRGARLHVLLDTSSSMAAFLPLALGMLLEYAAESDAAEIRLVRSNGRTLEDEVVAPEDLARLTVGGPGDDEVYAPNEPCESCGYRHAFRIRDAAPTSLGAAIESLGRDPQVESVAIVTDGFVSLPSRPPPYGVCWLQFQGNAAFQPAFGAIVRVGDS